MAKDGGSTSLESVPPCVLLGNVLNISHTIISLQDIRSVASARSNWRQALRATAPPAPSNDAHGSADGAGAGVGYCATIIMEAQLLQAVAAACQPHDLPSTTPPSRSTLLHLQESLSTVQYTRGFAHRLLGRLYTACPNGMEAQTLLQNLNMLAAWDAPFDGPAERSQRWALAPQALPAPEAARSCMQAWCPVAVSWLCLGAWQARDVCMVAHLVGVAFMACNGDERAGQYWYWPADPLARELLHTVLSRQPGIIELLHRHGMHVYVQPRPESVGCAVFDLQLQYDGHQEQGRLQEQWRKDVARGGGSQRDSDLGVRSLGAQVLMALAGLADCMCLELAAAAAASAAAEVEAAGAAAAGPSGAMPALKGGAVPTVGVLSDAQVDARRSARGVTRVCQAQGQTDWSNCLKDALTAGPQLSRAQVVACLQLLAGSSDVHTLMNAITAFRGTASLALAVLGLVDAGQKEDGVLRGWLERAWSLDDSQLWWAVMSAAGPARFEALGLNPQALKRASDEKKGEIAQLLVQLGVTPVQYGSLRWRGEMNGWPWLEEWCAKHLEELYGQGEVDADEEFVFLAGLANHPRINAPVLDRLLSLAKSSSTQGDMVHLLNKLLKDVLKLFGKPIRKQPELGLDTVLRHYQSMAGTPALNAYELYWKVAMYGGKKNDAHVASSFRVLHRHGLHLSQKEAKFTRAMVRGLGLVEAVQTITSLFIDATQA